MTRSILTLCFLLAVPAAARSQANDIVARIDSMVSARVQADAFSGAVLFADRTGIRYQRAAGLADRDQAVPITVDTRLQIASATKLFTHIAIRQLEQQGKLAISDTVGRFLPDYPNPVVRSKVTIEQLIRHRSGVGSFWNEAYMARRAQVRTVKDYLELFQNDALLFEPGTSEAYSNGGYVILGAIIERLSGQSYHDYIQEKVLGPAGMTNTIPYDSRASPAGSAMGYTAMPSGPMPGDRRLAGPGAAPRDTAAPAGQRMRIRGPDGRELSPAEVAEARAQRAAAGAVRRPNAGSKPGLSGPAGDHFSTVGDFLRLALALTSYKLLDSARTASVLGARYARGDDFIANGGSAGVNAELSIFPTGEVVVVLSNYDPPAATDVAQFIRGLVRGAKTTRTHLDGPERVVARAGATAVPMVKLGDFYFVDVRVGDVPFRFTVETGANHVAVSRALVERLGLQLDSVTTALGTAAVVRLPALSIGGVVFHGVVARVVPGFAQEPEFHGLLSIPLFNGVVATFDFPRRELRLGGAELGDEAMQIDYRPGQRVSVPIVVGDKPLSAVVDTRSPLGVIVPDSMLAEIRPVGEFGETVRARGPSLGDFTLRPARVAGFTVGGQTVPEATVHFRNRPGVVLGLPVLEQFVLTLDLGRQRASMVMPPGVRLAVQPMTATPPPRVYLGFGLVPQRDGGKTVAQVAPGSSADKQGLREGDQIISLDGVSAAQINPAVMRQAAEKGVAIRVVVRREGKNLVLDILPHERR